MLAVLIILLHCGRSSTGRSSSSASPADVDDWGEVGAWTDEFCGRAFDCIIASVTPFEFKGGEDVPVFAVIFYPFALFEGDGLAVVEPDGEF